MPRPSRTSSILEPRPERSACRATHLHGYSGSLDADRQSHRRPDSPGGTQQTRSRCLDDALFRVDPAIDAAEVLARNWNDRLPASENIAAISWWLCQDSETDSAA